MDLFITCSGTLESLLVKELHSLGFSNVVEGYRGVYVKDVPFSAIYRINYNSRLGGRVLMPIAHFDCYDSKSLYQNSSKINWQDYLLPDKSFAIDANVTHDRLRNSLFAAQVLKDAICDQLREARGERPNVNVQDPDVQLNLHIHQNRATLSFDTSGKPLFKRGYRQEAVEAPIQETLAAALLTLANFTGEEVIYDPCCGSGTILIEAALMASRTPPGFLREYWGFMALPQFSIEEWEKIKQEADCQRIELPKQRFFGTDINKHAIHSCRVNLRVAGLHQSVQIIHEDFRNFEPTIPPSFVICNPPHGNRLGEVESLRGLYRSLGDWMKRKTVKPAKGFIFTTNRELSKEVGLSASKKHVLEMSGEDARLLEFDLY